MDKVQSSNRKKESIILIGMPGAGKSSIGVVLAKMIGYRFVDTDLLIQEQENKLLSEIIRDEGEEGFLAIEEEVNANVSGGRVIIAPGGSVVYGPRAMEHFKEIGQVIYLHIPYRQLRRRLGNLQARGVVLKPGQTLKDLFEERRKLYEAYADITIEEIDRDLEGTVELVIEAWKNTEN